MQRLAGEERAAVDGENSGRSLAELREGIKGLDLAEAARCTGGRFSQGRLTVKVLAKDFSVDGNGVFSSTIHIIPWATVPFLTYVTICKGVPTAGEWISFREIGEGRERYPLFKRRCEEAMKRVADILPELFDNIVHLFDGRQVAAQFASDISVVLPLLPRVPMMICYWRESAGIASGLNDFFDKAVDENPEVGAVYMLATGLTQMFEKLAVWHGHVISPE